MKKEWVSWTIIAKDSMRRVNLLYYFNEMNIMAKVCGLTNDILSQNNTERKRTWNDDFGQFLHCANNQGTELWEKRTEMSETRTHMLYVHDTCHANHTHDWNGKMRIGVDRLGDMLAIFVYLFSPSLLLPISYLCRWPNSSDLVRQLNWLVRVFTMAHTWKPKKNQRMGHIYTFGRINGIISFVCACVSVSALICYLWWESSHRCPHGHDWEQRKY